MSKNRAKTQHIDPVDQPLYSVSQASYVVGVPESTLDRWFYGHVYTERGKTKRSSRVIVPADHERGLLSFINLTEAHVLESIRQQRFSLQAIREAVEYLQQEYGPHPLTTLGFYKRGKQLFVRKLSERQPHEPAISVSRPTQGQVELGNLLNESLDRITRDARGLPFRLFPMRRNPDRRIVSDLYIASGEPVIAGTGILAQFVFERYSTGETIPDIAADYDIDEQAVNDAIRYVSAA